MLRKNNIAYHPAFKKLLGLPKLCASNVVCDILNCLTFEHYQKITYERRAYESVDDRSHF